MPVIKLKSVGKAIGAPAKPAPFKPLTATVGKTVKPSAFVSAQSAPGFGTTAVPASAPIGSASGGVPASTPLPPDPVLSATEAGLQRTRDTSLASLGAQRQGSLLDYGYTEQPGGALTFDPSNPYSRAAQMKLRYDQARTGANNSYAARGQLYSGALQNQRDYLNSQQATGEDTLQKSLAQFLAGNTSAQATAKNDYTSGASQAEATSVANAASNPLYKPAVTPSPAASSAPTVAGEKPIKSFAGKSSKGVAGTWHEYASGRKVFIAG